MVLIAEGDLRVCQALVEIIVLIECHFSAVSIPDCGEGVHMLAVNLDRERNE